MAEERDFRKLLQARWDQGCNVCVGLDSDPTKLPPRVANVQQFNIEIIKATAPYACAFKPNAAFYEANGTQGWEDLKALTTYAHTHFPEIPFILDAKRGDNGNSNVGYVQSIFDCLRFDAVTVHSYLGREPLKPFLDRGEKGIFVLVRTSNPGAGELQDLEVGLTDAQCEELAQGPSGSTPDLKAFSTGTVNRSLFVPLYRVVALRVANHWNTNGNCGVVVGATYSDALRSVRSIAPAMPILIPGVGAQGGRLESAVTHSKNSSGDGMLLSASRSILYASRGSDFAEAAAAEAERLNGVIQSLRR